MAKKKPTPQPVKAIHDLPCGKQVIIHHQSNIKVQGTVGDCGCCTVTNPEGYIMVYVDSEGVPQAGYLGIKIGTTKGKLHFHDEDNDVMVTVTAG